VSEKEDKEDEKKDFGCWKNHLQKRIKWRRIIKCYKMDFFFVGKLFKRADLNIAKIYSNYIIWQGLTNKKPLFEIIFVECSKWFKQSCQNRLKLACYDV
jgi:hypothetical protein